MKVLNIVRFLPIEGLAPENDITFKIYADLRKAYQVDTLFIYPATHIPKWVTKVKKSSVKSYNLVNNVDYQDKNYLINVRFFQSLFPYTAHFKFPVISYHSLVFQFKIYKKNIYKICNNYQPDLIHAHTVQDAYYAYKISKKYGVPYIITLRGIYNDIYELKIVKKILNKAKKIITPSYSLKKKLDTYYKIDLLPHGLEEEWYTKDQKEFSEKELRLVSVSRFLDWKNVHIILESLSMLKKSGIKFVFDHIGDGPLRMELEKLVDQLNLNKEVTFHGLKTPKEIREIYKNSDVFVMLSYRETFGRVYFEAAAQGLLLVGVKNAGIDGYFTDGEAFIIDPTVEKTVEAFQVINKEVFQLKTKKSKIKIKQFKNENIISQYFDLIQRVISKKSS